MSRGWEANERDVLSALTLLACESHVYQLHLENARPIVEQLAANVDDMNVNMLLTSVAAALADPARLGNPRHIGRLAATILRELET